MKPNTEKDRNIYITQSPPLQCLNILTIINIIEQVIEYLWSHRQFLFDNLALQSTQTGMVLLSLQGIDIMHFLLFGIHLSP